MVTGIFSYMQNSKSENLMASFAGMLPPKVKLMRGENDDRVGKHLSDTPATIFCLLDFIPLPSALSLS